MPSPPLSPKPQRWRPRSDEPHPDIQALLSTFDDPLSLTNRGLHGARSEPDPDRQAPPSPRHRRAESDVVVPEIRTTSPYPRRASLSALSSKSTQRSASPLEAPSSSHIFGQTPQETAGRSGLTRGGSVSGPRANPSVSPGSSPSRTTPGESSLARANSLRPVHPQATGQSTNTLDAAYDNVFSTLDLLGSGPSLSLNNPSTPTPPEGSTASYSSSTSFSPDKTTRIIDTSITEASSQHKTTSADLTPAVPQSLRPRVSVSVTPMERLEAVSERTEPTSPAPSIPASPVGFKRAVSRSPVEAGPLDPPLGSRYPLPPSPVKSGTTAAGGGQASPTKASDLIKMFEHRGGGAHPAPPPPPVFSKASQGWVSQPLRPPQPTTVAPPPSSYRPPQAAPPVLESSSSASYVTADPFSPPPKPPSPLSSVKTLIASWRARSGSPTQRVVGSPGQGSQGPSIFGRERSWNVSIRRRRRNGDSEEPALAEQGVDPLTPSHLEPLPGMIEAVDAAIAEEEALLHTHRSPSVRSIRSNNSTGPRQLTGEPLRTGTLYYLNVHDEATAPFYEWIQTDARLFAEGLQLIWRLPTGAQAMVTLDLDYCEGMSSNKVASTYSPNNPAARDDLGTMAAQRQGELADNLYPFKLVYDDGTERLACDSARDRVRWVNAIWNALERSRRRPISQAGSIRSERPLSMLSRSEGGGSASTQYTPLAGGPTTGSSGPRAVQPPSHPMYTTDDQVVLTSGGFAAPLAHRESRRLAASGPERARSLRRVASEADLSETTQQPAASPDRRSVPDVLDIPLTTDAARSRPGSRDFAFAGGVAPPPIVLSPPPEYSSPLRARPLASIPESSSQTMATAAEILSSPEPISSYRAPLDDTSVCHTVGAPSDVASRAPLASTAMPPITQVEITQPSPSGSWESETMANEPFESTLGTAPQSMTGSHYSTARQSAYSTAATQPEGSSHTFGPPDETRYSTVRDSASSYHSAPPPVPSKYATASERSELDAPIRYQLHDPEVKWGTASQGRGSSISGDVAYHTPRIPTSHMTAAETRMSSPYRSALTSTSPRSSAYESAPPPPISRSSSGAEKLSYRSDVQDRAETATHISEPEPDVGLLADLERRSSIGSLAPGTHTRSAKTRTYYTANQTVGTGRTPLGTAYQNTMYDTARDSAYTTAQSWATPATTAQGTQESYFTAKTSQTPVRGPPSSVSTAQSVVSSNIRRVPAPPMPPPSSGPPSGSGEDTSTTGSSRTVRPSDFGHDMNRMLNYLQGQDQAGQGERARLASQLDRMENKLDRLVYDRPPPLPSKSDSPPSSPSSVSSTSTARPITPPLMPDAVAQQLDDMRRLLGTVIGQNNDLMQARRSYDVDLPPSGPGMRRIEDLLRRALYRLGDSDVMEEDGLNKYPADLGDLLTPSTPGREGSWYRGGNSIYSSEFDPRYGAPDGSYTSEHAKRIRGKASPAPSDLLDPYVGSPEFDEDFAMQNLPPETPPSDFVAPKTMLPPHLADHLRGQRPQPRPQTPRAESVYTEEAYPSEPQLPETPKHQTPVPYHPSAPPTDDMTVYSDDDQRRGPARPMPPPQPVDLPTPVGSKENYNIGGPAPGPAVRPGFPGASGIGGMPPPPGIAEMARPSLPRIAGVRDPISTTYFRRGFPPPGPMGPMGMFPGPMGVPGPGMGPFMPGLRPGLTGFGGPIGPNVGPGPRRPGFFPPGVPGTSGDYGLPAASRYGPAGPARPTAGPDTGLGNTTDETLTPTTVEEELVTPFVPEKTLEPAIHTPSGETDDSFRRTLGNAQDLAQAQGEQQNEISRYLHGMSDQIEDARQQQNADLANLLADISRLRAELQPKHVAGHVLPDGRVVLANGDVVQGVRGVPSMVPAPAAPVPPPTGGTVQGRILPDGRVMADGKIVDGIMATPSPTVPVDPQVVKDTEQDKKLADLQSKIESLMKPATVHEHSDVKEHEVVKGPAGTIKEIDREEEIERTVAGPGAGTSAPTAGTVSAVEETVETAPAASAPALSTRINPRTGKPLSIPKPLSLAPRDMSPIQTPADGSGGQLIREEHEEIVQRPGGGPPVVTKSTTRTYTQPNGAKVTATDPSVAPVSTAGPTARDFANVPTGPGAQFSDHQSVVEGPPAAGPPATKSVQEVVESDPANVPMDTKTTSVSKTTGARPAGVADAAAPAPPASAANVPGAGKPGKTPKDKPMFETNHPKPITTVSNVPNAPAAGPTGASAPPPAAGAPPPMLVEADPGPTPAAGPPGAAAAPPPAVVATPAPSGGKARPNTPKPGKPGEPAKVPAGQTLGNQPTVMPSGPPGAPGAPPPTQLANVPDASHPGAPGAAPPTTTLANVPDQPVYDTNHPKPVGTSGGGGGLLTKLKPQKSQEKITTTTTTPTPSGPPIVGATTPPAGGKQTRFSDTAHAVSPPPDTIVSNIPQDGSGGGPAIVTTPAPGAAPGATLVDTTGPNKLRKGKPAVHQEGLPAVPGFGPGTVVATPGGGPSGTPPPSVVQSTPAPAGTPATTKVTAATPPAGAKIVPTPAGTPGPAANIVTPDTLEEVILPDGRTAYVRPAPPAGKKGKTTEDVSSKTKVTGAVPAESALGQGHCSVCCPSAPRTGHGVPIEPCAHQDGPLGPVAPASIKDKKKVTQTLPPVGPTPGAGPLNLPGETAVAVEEERTTAPDGSNKLKKKVTAGPPVMPLSSEERAMEDARTLATKQKAAKELSDKEAADTAAREKAKADKIKLGEDRHKQNVEALANLQKALDGLIADGKTRNTSYDERVKIQEKRRADKTTRDKKFQDAFDALAKDRDEAKKRQVADDKKPGTQAVLDALKTSGDSQAAFLRKLATEIMEQNSNQHKGTQQAAQNAAREQVGFNLAGYLDDFSKALSGEVRSLLKEVGDLRENRRALYMELADLLLMKGRQSAGDLMAVLPYPTQAPKQPGAAVKKDPPKPPGGGGGGGDPGPVGAKAPAGVPAWSSFMPPAAPIMGAPNRPLPQPGAIPALNFAPGAVPPPPPANTRPLPMV